MMRSVSVLRALVLVGCVALCGCASVKEIRVQNISDRDFSDVRIGDRQFGDIAADETTPYRKVQVKSGYADMEMIIAGRRVTAQALNFGADRFTYRIDIRDLSRGHLDIKLVRE